MEPEQRPIETLVIGDAVEKEQAGRLRERKAKRDVADVRRRLDAVGRVAATQANLTPTLIEAARARCTVGEVMNALADVFGRYDGAAKW